MLFTVTPTLVLSCFLWPSLKLTAKAPETYLLWNIFQYIPFESNRSFFGGQLAQRFLGNCRTIQHDSPIQNSDLSNLAQWIISNWSTWRKVELVKSRKIHKNWALFKSPCISWYHDSIYPVFVQKQCWTIGIFNLLAKGYCRYLCHLLISRKRCSRESEQNLRPKWTLLPSMYLASMYTKM